MRVPPGAEQPQDIEHELQTPIAMAPPAILGLLQEPRQALQSALTCEICASELPKIWLLPLRAALVSLSKCSSWPVDQEKGTFTALHTFSHVC